jgi:hypothetical protein
MPALGGNRFREFQISSDRVDGQDALALVFDEA